MSMAVGKRGGAMADINVTPLVDVVLVLLIIFMMVVPMARKAIDIQLPDPNPTVQPANAKSDQIVLGTFFNGGLRAYDISNPYQPQQVGVFVPPAPPMAPTGTIQLNDVFVDDREIVYTVDRHIGGLYILEMDF